MVLQVLQTPLVAFCSTRLGRRVPGLANKTMSRFTLEPLMAMRHLSNPPNSPRKGVHSKLLSALDQEMGKLNFGETTATTAPSERYSNAMKLALTSGGHGGMASGGPSAVQTMAPLFLPKSPSVISTGAPSYQKNTVTHNDAGTPVSPKYSPHDTQQQTTSELPQYTYKSISPPPIRYYVRNAAEADELASKLRGPLGFDLEWRVLFAPKMIERRTAVLQLCDERMILVLQLAAMRHVPRNVKEIMERRDIIKTGVNILNDGRKLQRDFDVNSAGLLELSHLARLVDPSRIPSKRMIGLQRIVEMYTGCTLSKGKVRTSNWEAKLSEEQLEYAANDAHSALNVFMKLMAMARNMEMDIKPIAIPNGSPMGITFVSESAMGLNSAPAPKGASRRAASKKHQPSLPVAGIEGRARNQARVPDAMHVTSVEQLEVSKTPKPKPVGGQLLRAYKLWHEEQLPLAEICGALRSPANPLAKGTVITYIISALRIDGTLPFSKDRVKELVQLDYASSKRYGWWVASLSKTERGIES